MSDKENWNKWQERACEVENSRADNFKSLIQLSGLDPTKHLRFADWSGVDFSGCDLNGYDFTGARLHGCNFKGARIVGARFDQAEIGAVIHQPGRDPHAPAKHTAMANLRDAEDWDHYASTWRVKTQSSLGAIGSYALGGSYSEPVTVPSRHLPVGAIFQDAPFAPEMVVVPAGSFIMGSPEGGSESSQDECPQREVTIARPYAVGRYAVTFDEWDAYIANTSGNFIKWQDEGWGRGNRPGDQCVMGEYPALSRMAQFQSAGQAISLVVGGGMGIFSPCWDNDSL